MTPVGALGLVSSGYGVTEPDGALDALVPTELVAVTVNV
jgi:hypothetical protein